MITDPKIGRKVRSIIDVYYGEIGTIESFSSRHYCYIVYANGLQVLFHFEELEYVDTDEQKRLNFAMKYL